MAFWRYWLTNFYATTIANNYTLTPWVDWILPLVSVPNVEDWKMFFVVFNVIDPVSRLVLPVYMDWWQVKYKWYNVLALKELLKYDEVAVNDVAELFDVIFNTTDDFWTIILKWALEIDVYWGDVVMWNDLFSVIDTPITLTDNTTNYIIFDYADQTLKTVEVLPSAYYILAEIVTAWWVITSKTWKRAFNVSDYFSWDFFVRNASWEIVIKDEGVTWTQIDFWSFNADEIFEWATHKFISQAELDGIALNTANRHTHANKAILDTYDQLNIDIEDAVVKKHTHPNKALLDTYDQVNTDIEDAVVKKHTHTNKPTLDLIPSIVWVPDTYVPTKIWATIQWLEQQWSGGTWDTTPRIDVFIWDWTSDWFVLNHEPISDNAVFMYNDSWQRYYQGEDYSRSWLTVTFFDIPDVGRKIYVQYFENLSVSVSWETNTMANLPWTWIGVYKQKAWVQFEMRRVTWINWIQVTQVWDEIVIDWTISVWPWWEANTASNVWAWVWIFKAKNWVDIQLKSILNSETINVIDTDDEAKIEVNEDWLSKNYHRIFMYW